MKVFVKIKELQSFLELQRKAGKAIGFVPTMGALHAGHISLIERSKKENDITACSIFVNPTQFNDKKDLEKYPRPIEKDTRMLKEAQCDVLFTPAVEEMYPEKSWESADSQLNLGMLDKVMEGAHRPGHFKGVITIVSKLFDIVQPQRAYFGQKDFQQLAIITEMTKQLNYAIQIVPCAIMREPDGLAMSSRNIRLSPDERKAAAHISHTLFEAQKMELQRPVSDLKSWVKENICKEPLLQLEYFEIVDSKTLTAIKNWSDAASSTGCIAVKVGEVRLIDNIVFK